MHIPYPAGNWKASDRDTRLMLRRRPDEEGGDAEFPGSEPEIQAVLRFFAGHPNVFGAINFHTYSRAILRPFSAQPDEQMDAQDQWVRPSATAAPS